jgi:single-strand DNA-binding protein
MNWTDQSGQKQSKAEFHNIVAWRKLADICGQYLHKGTKVYIEGRLQTRDWVGQDGAKKYRTEVVADTMQILSRPGEVNATPAPSENFEEAVGAEGDANADEEIKIENIPF